MVLAIVLGFVYFGFGTSRLLMNSQENFGWLALLMLAVCVLVCVPAWKYFARAHGIKERGAPPLLPMLAFYFALMGLTLFVLPVLVSAFENWWSFAFACLILATLNVAPVRISLLRSPDEAPESRISSGS
ncbi:hypothetical protein [Nesterenkonia flava]|uniref:Uncharacterized protein n=1 Tax=Nesterenkonia flava TaxID=469799 RepID=A0ABU1FRP5_9MICC|nr:hypothetical protein [Nesterenkonia flava]MDR5711002.1 hypothetical protein [Nesterenkonia flava]